MWTERRLFIVMSAVRLSLLIIRLFMCWLTSARFPLPLVILVGGIFADFAVGFYLREFKRSSPVPIPFIFSPQVSSSSCSIIRVCDLSKRLNARLIWCRGATGRKLSSSGFKTLKRSQLFKITAGCSTTGRNAYK